MKRVTLNIDLEDNQIFDEQVVETIKAKVRELVRNENYNYVASETKKELDRLIADSSWYSSTINRIIKDKISNIVHDVLTTTEMRQKLSDALDSESIKFINRNQSVIESYCEAAVQKKLNDDIAKKLNNIFK